MRPTVYHIGGRIFNEWQLRSCDKYGDYLSTVYGATMEEAIKDARKSGFRVPRELEWQLLDNGEGR